MGMCIPITSAMEQKPNSMRGSLGGSTAEEFTVFNDNSVLDQNQVTYIIFQHTS